MTRRIRKMPGLFKHFTELRHGEEKRDRKGPIRAVS